MSPCTSPSGRRSSHRQRVLATIVTIAAVCQPAPVVAQAHAANPRFPRWLYPAASLVVPGSGQLLAGRDRGLLYVAVEAAMMTRYLALRSEGRRAGTEFRDLAFRVARGSFEPIRRDTIFAYFEKLEAYVESGAFDLDPGPALAPPVDERTYNGSIWALARRTFFTNPDSTPATDSEEYQRALEFYRKRAVGPGFQWSWRNAGLEQDLYRRTIQTSDDAFRTATQYLGLLLANHLISAVDAFVSGRLSHGERDLSVTSSVWRGGRSEWEAALTVSIALRRSHP
jgi:hypothetical protein